MRIGGKVAVVVGGAQGMGLAFCEALLAKGAKVVLGDVLVKEGQETTLMLKAKFGEQNVDFIPCNAAKEEDVSALFAHARSKFGDQQVEIVMNNAGIVDEFNWKRCIDVNLGGVIRVTEEAFKQMGKQHGHVGGVCVHMASISGLRPDAWGPVYNASKFGIVGFTRAWALDANYVSHGVRLNCVCPTSVDTPFLDTYVTEEKMMHAAANRQYVATVDRIAPSFVAEGLIELIEDDQANGYCLRVTKAGGREVVQFEDHPLQ